MAFRGIKLEAGFGAVFLQSLVLVAGSCSICFGGFSGLLHRDDQAFNQSAYFAYSLITDT